MVEFIVRQIHVGSLLFDDGIYFTFVVVEDRAAFKEELLQASGDARIRNSRHLKLAELSGRCRAKLICIEVHVRGEWVQSAV